MGPLADPPAAVDTGQARARSKPRGNAAPKLLRTYGRERSPRSKYLLRSGLKVNRLTKVLGAVQRSGQVNPQQVLEQLREQSRRLTQAITGVQQVLSRRTNPGPMDEQPPPAG